MINTYDLFITRISHGKLPIPVDIHKNIISFVEKEYTVDNKDFTVSFIVQEVNNNLKWVPSVTYK